MPRVDIIMPLYNKAAVVKRAVDSIVKQTMDDWRLIVVDDGSTDSGADVVRNIDDSRIEIITQENAGPGAARNTGIDHATAKYVAFLDADDEWLEFYLENSLAAIEDCDVSMVGTYYYKWPGKISTKDGYTKRGLNSGEYFLTGDEDVDWAEQLMLFFHVDSSLLKTDTARKYGGFYAENNCRFAEDTTFFMRIVLNEKVMIIEPPAVCRHTEDSDLANLARDPLAPFLVDTDVVLKYCPDEKSKLMKAILNSIAFRSVRKLARRGYKQDAIELLNKFPSIKTSQPRYRRCAFEIATSRWFKYWVAFKCAVGPRARLFLRTAARKVGLMQDISDISERGCND